MEDFDKAGIENHYFVDDMKKYADCYADAFAKEISIKDANMIFDERTSETVKNAIINNIAYKYIDKCKKKYAPYMDEIKDIYNAYVEKACGTLDKSVLEKCSKKNSAEEIVKCETENDDWFGCFYNVMHKLQSAIENEDVTE